MAESITVVEDDASTETATVTSNNSYFTDARLYNDLVDAIEEEYGLSEDEAEYEVLNGGLRVYSTVDTDIQSSLEQLMLNEDDAIFPANWADEEVTTTIPCGQRNHLRRQRYAAPAQFRWRDGCGVCRGCHPGIYRRYQHHLQDHGG